MTAMQPSRSSCSTLGCDAPAAIEVTFAGEGGTWRAVTCANPSHLERLVDVARQLRMCLVETHELASGRFCDSRA